MPALARDFVSGEIDNDIALADDGGSFLGGGGAAEKSADAGDQLAGTEGLGDVIVSAKLQADDAVGFG